MANELTLTATFSLDNTTTGANVFKTISKQFDQLGQFYNATIQSVGTGTHEALEVGSVAETPAYLLLRNLSPVNDSPDVYVQVGLDVAATFYPLVELRGQQDAILPVATTAIYAQAFNDDVNLEVVIIEGVY